MVPSRTTSPNSDGGRSTPEGAAESDAAISDVTLRQLRNDDVRAFEAVFRRYYRALYNFAYPYVRSRDTAEELVQDVFCRLWERRRTAVPVSTGEEGADALRAYLYRAVRNAALNWLRHRQVEQRFYDSVDETAKPPGMGAAPPSADVAIQSEETRLLVDRAIATLPEPYREVLELRAKHQLSYPEIAEVLQVPLKTVETRVTRAFRSLREALGKLR